MTADSSRFSRRQVVKGIGSMAAAAPFAPPLIGSARGAPKVLKIMQWNHFVPAFDDWFNGTFIKEWGAANNTEVIVNNVGMTSLKGRATAEIAKQQGHDICMFLSPPASYEDQVIDHREIYEECRRLYGDPIDLAMKSTFNPKSGKYFGFSDSYVPDPINYRRDLWDAVGVTPNSWDEILRGGREIKKAYGVPVGIGLAHELDTNMAMRSILAAFGASVQTADGIPNLKSEATLEAIKFVKALYQEAMTDEVFSWDPSSNNRFMLAGKGSLTLNAISITRTGENQKIPVAQKISLARPATGPVARLGVMHLMNAYVVWKFALNIEGAKQFLVDLVGQSRRTFEASQFYNFPTFPAQIPDLKELVANDPKANPPDKYKIFADAEEWTIGVGYPGHANPAIDEVFSEWLIPRMFADAASGRLSPEESLDVYAAGVAEIFEKWRAFGKV